MRFYTHTLCDFVNFSKIFLCIFSSVLCLDSEEFQRNLSKKVVWAVKGKDVELPCDITPPLPSDHVRMVFWFKDTIGMPLYTLDARGNALNKASHLAMSDDLGSRSYFITNDQPSKARLRIQNVNIKDKGVFRCRVDFNNSPTRNFQVDLALVEQPSTPRIFDSGGNEIKNNSSAGPFLENEGLFLSCQVTGGNPRPVLTWWYNNTLLDSVIDSNKDSFTTVNQLVIAKIPRYMKKANLECKTSSSEIAGDIIRKIPLTVYLKPNKVKIVTPNGLLSVHKSHSIRCETSGSYPPAKLTWLLNGKPIRDAVTTEEETESFTGSILSLKVTAEDDGKDLICRADNSHFPGGSMEDKRQIHVAFPPKVVVKMDPRVNTSIREGTDIALHCDCLARPKPYSYSWYHDGHFVPYNESAGILPENNTLIIKYVNKKSEGQYACSAMNTEGETYSSPYELEIQYAPHCKKGFEIMRVGFIPYETVAVQCHVDSVPKVNRFFWTYNTSEGVLPIQGAKMKNMDGVSTLFFTPDSNEVESLSCWASNDVGDQKVPCLFYISPAAIPESPRSCSLRNASYRGLEVSCEAGEDGGLHQSFILEVSDISMPILPSGVTTLSDQSQHFSPLYRVLGDRPLFRLHSLQPGREYQILVYAENAKGRSEPPVLLPNVKVEVPMDPLQETIKNVAVPKEPSTKANLAVILMALTAAAVLLIVGIVAAACVIACRKSHMVNQQQDTSGKPSDDLELSEAGFSEGFHRRSAQYRASMYSPPENDVGISRLIEGPDLILSPISFTSPNPEF